MKTRDADILIIPGLGGSGPDHWQTRWEGKLPTARRVVQDDWSRPDHAAWLHRIEAAIVESTRSVVLVAHSLGVIAAAGVLLGTGARVAGAFLVAPPEEAAVASIPEIDPEFRPYPHGTIPSPTVMVGSTDDPYATYAATEALARGWGATLLNAGAAGHINVDSGHGPWPEGLMSFAGFLAKL